LLITDSYRRLNAEMHRQKPNYGSSGARHAGLVLDWVKRTGCKSILDYGCGKGTLKLAIGRTVNVREYDPAIEGKDATPEPADMVVCGDVMEHIEPDCLDAVLADIQRCATKLAMLVISTVPSAKHLPDGRNAHVLVQPPEWWLPRLMSRWDLVSYQGGENGFLAVLKPKERS
jgi:2-polyprenyl-3-methyl-5-hydroxy-6-metoxy-1,4-benzoquinol methylase